jgi:AcrR family transcriptional regulator
MAPPTRTPRATWIEAGLGALAAGGPDAVRIELLAKSLGVTRGGFYGHFDDRAALLDAMLDAWERAAIDDVHEQVERRGGDPRTKVRRAGALTFSEKLLPIDLAIREWSRRDPAVAARLTRVDNRRMEYLRLLFASFCADEQEVEAR